MHDKLPQKLDRLNADVLAHDTIQPDRRLGSFQVK